MPHVGAMWVEAMGLSNTALHIVRDEQRGVWTKREGEGEAAKERDREKLPPCSALLDNCHCNAPHGYVTGQLCIQLSSHNQRCHLVFLSPLQRDEFIYSLVICFCFRSLPWVPN